MTERIAYRGSRDSFGAFEVFKASLVILSSLISMMAIGSGVSLLIWWMAQ